MKLKYKKCFSTHSRDRFLKFFFITLGQTTVPSSPTMALDPKMKENNYDTNAILGIISKIVEL